MVKSISSCGALRIAPWRSPKTPEMKAQTAKNSKMEVVPALINSLYGRLGKRTSFGNLWGNPEADPERGKADAKTFSMTLKPDAKSWRKALKPDAKSS